MPRIAATLETVIEVQAPARQVYELFADPRRMTELMPDIESVDFGSDGTVRWVLLEKISNGIRFKGDYTVRYENNGRDKVSWVALEGNLGSTGEVTIFGKGSASRINYRETVEPDLPISPLMARLLRPIIAKELRRDVELQLARVKEFLESGGSLVPGAERLPAQPEANNQ